MWELRAYNRGDCIFSCRFHPDDLEWKHVWAGLGEAIHRACHEPLALHIYVLSPQGQLTS